MTSVTDRCVLALLLPGLPIFFAGCSLPPQHKYSYTCPDGYAFTVTYAGSNQPGDIAVFKDASGTLKLPRAPAASGARYSNGLVVYWSKGDEAMIRIGDEMAHQGCSTDPDQVSSPAT